MADHLLFPSRGWRSHRPPGRRHPAVHRLTTQSLRYAADASRNGHGHWARIAQTALLTGKPCRSVREVRHELYALETRSGPLAPRRRVRCRRPRQARSGFVTQMQAATPARLPRRFVAGRRQGEGGGPSKADCQQADPPVACDSARCALPRYAPTRRRRVATDRALFSFSSRRANPRLLPAREDPHLRQPGKFVQTVRATIHKEARSVRLSRPWAILFPG